MRFDIEHLADKFPEEVLAAQLGVADALVERADEVRLIVTGNWEASLKRYAPPQTYNSIAKEIGAGLALSDPERSDAYIILVRASLPATDDPVRNVAHEALHVANLQRGEPMQRFGFHLQMPRLWYGTLAGQMVEEYRVELALNQMRWPSDLCEQIDERYQEALDARDAYVAAPFDEDLWMDLRRKFRTVGYMAAHYTAKYGLDELSPGGELHAIATILDPLPTARQAASRECLVNVASHLAYLLHRWTIILGFELVGEGEGKVHPFGP